MLENYDLKTQPRFKNFSYMIDLLIKKENTIVKLAFKSISSYSQKKSHFKKLILKHVSRKSRFQLQTAFDHLVNNSLSYQSSKYTKTCLGLFKLFHLHPSPIHFHTLAYPIQTRPQALNLLKTLLTRKYVQTLQTTFKTWKTHNYYEEIRQKQYEFGKTAKTRDDRYFDLENLLQVLCDQEGFKDQGIQEVVSMGDNRAKQLTWKYWKKLHVVTQGDEEGKMKIS